MRPQNLSIDRIKGHTFLRNHISRDGIVIDLGMNRADFANAIHNKYGCAVLGVEANPVLAAENAEMSGVTCRNAAVAQSDGFVKFLINKDNLEASKIVPDSTAASDDIVTVPSISLSSLIRDVNADRVDLLKFDIEGAELDVIETTTPAVLWRCDQIAVEFHSFIYPSDSNRVDRVIVLLSEIGFYPIDFSTEKNDVLFINCNVIDMPAAARTALQLQKYRSGIARRLLRWAIAAGVVTDH